MSTLPCPPQPCTYTYVIILKWHTHGAAYAVGHIMQNLLFYFFSPSYLHFRFVHSPIPASCCSLTLLLFYPHIALHCLPIKEDIRAKWLHSIHYCNIPPSGGKSTLVCPKHFMSNWKSICRRSLTYLICI